MNSLLIDNVVMHNFCESRLTNYYPPEIVNAYTSLFITCIPIIYGFPKNRYFFYIAILFILNGFASLYYHYYLNYIGKISDEICMILINYYCILGFMNVNYNNQIDNQIVIKQYQNYNQLATLLFILFNCIQYFDFLFPFLFATYVIPTLYLSYQISQRYNYNYYSLCFSFIGIICWIVSEVHCNEYTYLGHAIWHITFPLGVYKLVLLYDRKTLVLIY